ncbi:MAG: PAS domain-containing sensor histidine kinase [Nannocystaceae bacterium]|nr:PAS domain S-box protein [Myxococcales bacterium]
MKAGSTGTPKPLSGFFIVAPEPMCLLTRDGRIVEINAAFARVFGFALEAVVGKPLTELAHSDDREVFAAEIAQVGRERGRAELTGRVACADGSHRWITCALVAGEHLDTFIYVLARDVTEEKRWEAMLRRQAQTVYQVADAPLEVEGESTDAIVDGRRVERALHQSQWLLRLLIEHTPAAVAMFDVKMRFLLVSRRFLTDYRLDGQDLIGRVYYDVFPEATRETREIHRRCLAGAVERRAEDPFRRQSGTVEWLRWEIRPWRHTNGDIGGIILFTEHITAEKDAREQLKLYTAELAGKNQQLMDALDKAELASQAKNQFVASMSHELRTPLNAIIGYAEMLEEDANERGLSDFAGDLDRILEAGRRLLRLTDEVLDLAHLEAGKAKLKPINFEISEIVEAVVASVSALAESRGNKIEVRGLEGVGTMHADVTKVRQCLLNLISNACKFTGGGAITVSVEEEWGRTREGDRVRFVIHDTGAVEPERVDRLFDPYGSPDAPVTGRGDGTGLGLAITRRFCELMGGEVYADSRPGVGSTFTMVIPRYTQRRTFALASD